MKKSIPQKYQSMADQFRADGADEKTIRKWIQEEMQGDEFARKEGSSDIEAYKIWMSWPQERRSLYLGNAFCSKCSVTSFAPGYNIRKDRFGLIVEGNCATCGAKICRCCD